MSTSTITADVHGEPVVVDLTKVSALDALAFRIETDVDLEVFVARWLTRPDVPTLADHGVLVWLEARQNGQPHLPLATALAMVPLLPAPSKPEPAAVPD